MPKKATPDDSTGTHPAYGPDQRRLLEGAGAELYAEAVSQDGLRVKDKRFSGRGRDRAALDLLLDLGVLTLDPTQERYVAKDPSASQARVVTPLGQQGAELITESSRWADAFGTLTQTWRRSPIAAHGPFTELQGLPAINKFLEEAANDATAEVLTAQPQASRGTIGQLMAAATHELQALERGVAIRTLYQHSARRNAATHKYVRAVTLKGAEVRTLDEFFNRIIIFDRTQAVIPGAEKGAYSAVVIRDPAVVGYLVDVFERAWERARPFGNQEIDTMRDIASEQRAMTIRMLIQGHADPASAKRLGVSPRTYAGYVADLKDEYEAETRFQLGYYMGQRGITGEDVGESHSG